MYWFLIFFATFIVFHHFRDKFVFLAAYIWKNRKHFKLKWSSIYLTEIASGWWLLNFDKSNKMISLSIYVNEHCDKAVFFYKYTYSKSNSAAKYLDEWMKLTEICICITFYPFSKNFILFRFKVRFHHVSTKKIAALLIFWNFLFFVFNFSVRCTSLTYIQMECVSLECCAHFFSSSHRRAVWRFFMCIRKSYGYILVRHVLLFLTFYFVCFPL